MSLPHRSMRRHPSTEPPERIDPLTEPPGVVAHHAAKYAFASRSPGSDVLDVGCGFGYGTHILSQRFARVTGIDLEEQAVRAAHSRYQDASCSFCVMNASALAFGDGAFDLVTCFEVIEHLPEVDKHLSEVVRLLRPGGHYVVSTPMPGTGGSPAENPFHLNEFSEDALVQVLQRHFDTVELFTQAKRRSSKEKLLRRLDVLKLRRLSILRSVIRRLGARTSVTASEDASIDDFEISQERKLDATEFVAICRAR